MKLNVKQLYTSIACNRIPEIVDWNEQGLICFGACNAVVIYDTVCFSHLSRHFNYLIVTNITGNYFVVLRRNTHPVNLNSQFFFTF